ncbi:MAG: TetR/AcrR family transcriptional regulator [Acidobacteria bacterium]|nr:TetR/AcrR family transcriptional regulator [Acidobacteriota bacterium]
MGTDDAAAAAQPTGRDRLLERVADHVLEHGATDLSLSELARAVGSNNRMLLYHFGSKEEALRQATLVAFERFPHLEGALRRLGEADRPLRARLLGAWQDIAHEDNLPFLALFFQAFGVALYHPERNRELLVRLGLEWVADVRAVLEREGVEQAAAERLATQLVAEWRGLQFALLSGADRSVLDGSYADLVDRIPLPVSGDPGDTSVPRR